MDSMPPATTTSDSPSCTACAARATALRPEPQTLLIVSAATRGSQPPLSAAWRAGFWPSPAWTTLPRIASSTCLGSIPARRMDSTTTLAPSSGAEKVERPPWNLPMGVRTAERMTGVSMEHLGIELKDYYSAEGDYAQNRPRKKEESPRLIVRTHPPRETAPRMGTFKFRWSVPPDPGRQPAAAGAMTGRRRRWARFRLRWGRRGRGRECRADGSRP